MNKMTRIFRGQTIELDQNNCFMGLHVADITDAVQEDGCKIKWDFKKSLEISEPEPVEALSEAYQTPDMLVLFSSGAVLILFGLLILLGVIT